MEILLSGIYPRSEELVSATRDYDRDRMSYDDMLDIRISDIKSLYKLQEGLACKSTGQLNWQDLLRPISEIVTNCKVRGLKRFFQTNTFWRTVEFEGESGVIKDEIDGWIDKYVFGEGIYDENQELLLTLPFLYSIERHISGLNLKRIADLMADIIKGLSSVKKLNIVFFEPTFGWRDITDEERELGIEFLEKVKDLNGGLVFITTSFFPLGEELGFLYQLPVDGVGIDFYSNSLSEIVKDFPRDKYILAGVVDVRSTLMETGEDIMGFTEELQRFIPADKIFLNPNGPPELLPAEVMNEKIENLKEVLE